MSDHKALARDFLAVIGVALIYVTPAFAAPPQIEDYCWAKAAQIWFSGRGDREHFYSQLHRRSNPHASDEGQPIQTAPLGTGLTMKPVELRGSRINYTHSANDSASFVVTTSSLRQISSLNWSIDRATGEAAQDRDNSP
jgi:hypothetical protein